MLTEIHETDARRRAAPAARQRVVVCTNLTPSNVGNQALSTELVSLSRRLLPGDDLLFFGRPPGFADYTARKLFSTRDPLATFDGWVEGIVQDYRAHRPPAGDLSRQRNLSRVRLAATPRLRSRLLPITRALRVRARLRRLFASAFAGERRQRLAAIDGAVAMLYNAAGELNSQPKTFDIPLRQFLELEVARRLGTRVYVVNHSVEYAEPAQGRLIGELYSRFDGILLRDHRSEKSLLELGVPGSKIDVVPDLGFMTRPSAAGTAAAVGAREGAGRGVVGVSINFWEFERYRAEWIQVLDHLMRSGKRVLFVSNALGQDRVVGESLQRSHGVRVQSREYDYDDYAALLGQLDLVISNRLHTCVFALAAGTPAVPVEPNVLKMTGLFEQIEYPVPVVDASRAGWSAALIASIDELARRPDFSSELVETIGRLRASVEAGYLRMFDRARSAVTEPAWE